MAAADTELRRRLPHIQTALPSSQTAHAQSISGSDHGSPPQATHQKFVLTDPVAFKYLEEDAATTVLDRRRELQGYECYIVEQWACSRTHPTFVITTFTGDPTHTVVAGVLGVPTDQAAWSPRLRVYFKALDEFHARRKETALGTLMITNLSGFPSSLTVIPIPEGDIRKHREDFIVNENLKRLGCSGRVGLSLAAPSDATRSKFHQLYRTSDKVPLYGSVIELVKLCQAALMLFDKLKPEYVDGLLCDVTERAVNDWWIDVGADYYSNVEPHDGILGPTTVAGLLGLLLGARNRLHALGAPVAKDAFDIDSTKRGVAYLQKTNRLPKTRRLDRRTLSNLHVASAAKVAAGEGWTVPRAVKSTVAELSGKGGEMVMDMVGGRDRAGIAEVESVDFDTFVQLVHGERCKWLWYGKRRKTAPGGSGDDDVLGALAGENEGMEFRKDDHGGYKWSSRRQSTFDDSAVARKDSILPFSRSGTSDSAQPQSATASKRSSVRIGDARSGFGRIKGAVGLRGHHHHHPKQSSKDEESGAAPDSGHASRDSPAPSEPGSPRTAALMAEETAAESQLFSPEATTPVPQGAFATSLVDTPQESDATGILFADDATPHLTTETSQTYPDGDDTRTPTPHAEPVHPPATPPSARPVDLADVPGVAAKEDPQHGIGAPFRRSQTYPLASYAAATGASDETEEVGARYPRHLSFSVAEEAVLTWSPVTVPHSHFPADSDSESDSSDSDANNAKDTAADMLSDDTDEPALRARLHLHATRAAAARFAAAQLAAVRALRTRAERDAQDLDALYYAALDGRTDDPTAAAPTRDDDASQASPDARAHRRAATAEQKDEVLARARAALSDSARDGEAAGARLEYEINVLRGRVEDVEDGVREFERLVVGVEERVREVGAVGGGSERVREGKEGGREGWGHWAWRVCTGLGRAPGAVAK